MFTRLFRLSGRDGGGGIRGWGTGDGWASDDAGANETRLRLLTLQGQWLEVEGRMLSEPTSIGKVGGNVANFRWFAPHARSAHLEYFGPGCVSFPCQ